MSNHTPFRFKQFSVNHDRCAMKVGTDAVLLGSISGSGNPKSILEIGVGTGVVSLMLAQRFPEARITGVEIDKEAWEQASENARQSPWKDRIEFKHISFQDFCENQAQKYDLIVSNPPFFPNHLKSLDPKRNLALHNDTLSFGELVSGVISLFHPFSEFWAILPPVQMEELEKLMVSKGLRIHTRTFIKDNPAKNILRVILGFSFLNHAMYSKDISIKDKNGNYSKDYSELLKEFLIVF
ncbi:tRNA1(Val) (adenine(37)-N6)-methyltransferase [Aquiflexum gelatinilyticum]|uniref:tRNA1(Val) (adenine(37)-N6)-methyltransferase n=1 Tax=Aquiflexum gelatinilyticum TaxID=2961943 RepID=A0A9X2T005_9BACT|nr:methyltransferase [Aquiflexum gelatinilyticum]MCR9017119.1 methyltransferase [Aquiflexum gelatinilyticum]